MARRGLLHAIDAANRRAERESAKRYRENLKRAKEYEKFAEQERARNEVELFEAHVDMLVSMHKDCRSPLNWKAIVEAPALKAPTRASSNEDLARQTLDGYRPGVFARLFRLVEKQRASLEAEVVEGRAADDALYASAQARHARQAQEWQERHDLAQGVLRGDLQAYMDAIEETNPFAEVAELGSTVTVSAHDSAFIEATVQVNTDRVVPQESKSLLSSGKLSVKTLAPSKFNEIYQDYVCGAALRVARELFALLPLDAVDVTAVVDGLNSATGRNEVRTILSVQVTRKIADGINFEMADPSDCMKNFVHTMKFTKSGGFDSIDGAAPRTNARRGGANS